MGCNTKGEACGHRPYPKIFKTDWSKFNYKVTETETQVNWTTSPSVLSPIVNYKSPNNISCDVYYVYFYTYPTTYSLPHV